MSLDPTITLEVSLIFPILLLRKLRFRRLKNCVKITQDISGTAETQHPGHCSLRLIGGNSGLQSSTFVLVGGNQAAAGIRKLIS